MRFLKSTLRRVFHRADYSAPPGKYRIPVLMYHAIGLRNEDDPNCVSSTLFDEHMNMLSDHYHCVGSESLAAYLGSAKDVSDVAAVTFDDGYEEMMPFVLDMTTKRKINPIVFITPDFLDKDNRWNRRAFTVRRHLSRQSVRLLTEAGWEVGAHGIDHQRLTKLSQAELHSEIVSCKSILEETFGICVSSFAYAYGAYNDQVVEIVKQHYRIAFAAGPNGRNDYNCNPWCIGRLHVGPSVSAKQLREQMQRWSSGRC